MANASGKMSVHIAMAGSYGEKDGGNLIKRVWDLEVGGKRARGRPKMKWKCVVMKDMGVANDTEPPGERGRRRRGIRRVTILQ